jgi:hypothetical protein
VALNIANIADAIAGLTISGVTVLDLNEIKEGIVERDCPVLFPRPDGYVTDFKVEVQSFGGEGERAMDVTYSLHYVLAYAAVGSGRGLFDKYPGMVNAAFAVIDAILANDTLGGDAVDVNIKNVPDFGLVNDPAGNAFHGFEIAINITELVN